MPNVLLVGGYSTRGRVSFISCTNCPGGGGGKAKNFSVHSLCLTNRDVGQRIQAMREMILRYIHTVLEPLITLSRRTESDSNPTDRLPSSSARGV